MEQFLGKYSSCLYATLRIIAGLMFAMHGSQKLFAWPGGNAPVPLASLMGVAGLVELIGGVMIAFGSSPPMQHSSPAAKWPSPISRLMRRRAHCRFNRGELSVVYCFLFLYIAAQGAGGWSLDAMMRRKQ